MQQYKSIIIGSALLMCAGFSYADKKVLHGYAYPAVDQIVKDLPRYPKTTQMLRWWWPGVYGSSYSDDHRPSCFVWSSDVMTIEYGYLDGSQIVAVSRIS